MLEQPFYYIDETGDRPVIRNKYTDMRLEVYNLEDEPFTAPAGKLVFYGEDHGTYIAMVAEYDHTRLTEISEALQWYAGYLDQTIEELNISLIDPRPEGTGMFN